MKKISLFRLDNFVFGLLLMLIGSWAEVSYAQVIPVEVQKLTIADMPYRGSFGVSVDMNDTTMVATAANLGKFTPVYVFEKKGDEWSEVARLTRSDRTDLDPLESVAISGDTIVAGCFRYPEESYRGAVYVFEKPAGGWSDMTETAKLTASDGGDFDFFGSAVAISGDTIVVGAWGYPRNSQNGTVYIFEKPNGGWTDMTETTKLVPPDGSVISPSSSSVRMVKNEQPKAGSGQRGPATFGKSVAVDEDVIVVGAPQDDISGSAYVYEKKNNDWIQTAKLTGSDYEQLDSEYFGFGYDVAVDENVILISFPYNDFKPGIVYLFEKPATGWSDITKTAKLSASDGEVDHYRGRDIFGCSVDVSGDTVVIGDRWDGDHAGSVYVFKKPSRGWSDMTETVKMTASDGMSGVNRDWGGDVFGTSVAIRGDRILVGAYNNGENYEGAVYIYQLIESSSIPAWRMFDK